MTSQLAQLIDTVGHAARVPFRRRETTGRAYLRVRRRNPKRLPRPRAGLGGPRARPGDPPLPEPRLVQLLLECRRAVRAARGAGGGRHRRSGGPGTSRAITASTARVPHTHRGHADGPRQSVRRLAGERATRARRRRSDGRARAVAGLGSAFAEFLAGRFSDRKGSSGMARGPPRLAAGRNRPLSVCHRGRHLGVVLGGQEPALQEDDPKRP
jgi:hypothetical protein